ncbi:hypothetical protein [Streptomyces sp. MNP-20]|uniref:hypothetical protein n=1 Tax=Streptomyces sp. MNP-20 TaxID=2721165 RepID=UPI001555C2BB|nr:hypothetical protein [Streptomyces sp. MNP-20]
MRLLTAKASTLSGIAVLAASAVLATAVPSLADSAPPGPRADETASAVEKATGTAGLTVPQTRGDTLVADAAGARVEMPRTGAGQLTITASTGTRIAIGLPGTAGAPAHTSAHGTVVYPQPQAPVDVAAQAGTDGSASALITLKNASAPTEYRFPLGLPDGAHAALLEEGGVVVGDSNGEVAGFFGVPWAKDATGKAVPTRYRLEGTTLIQSVRPSASTVYPVVADPKWLDEVVGVVGGVVHNTWSSVKCGGALGAAFVPGHKAYKAIKAAGGVKKVLATLAGVDTLAGAMAALGAGGTTLFGIKSIKKACFDDLK